MTAAPPAPAYSLGVPQSIPEVCGQQIEVTVTDGTSNATVTVGPLGCGRGRPRAPAGPGGQADPGGPFDPDPNNPDLPPIPGGAGGEMDNPTYGVGECNLEIVEPTTGQVIGGNVTVTLQITMAQGLSVTIDSVQAQEITDLHPVEWIPVYPSQGGGDPGNPGGGGLTQVSDTVVDGHRVLTYECTWNTLPTHNFPHRLVATATFSPGGEMPGGGGTGGVTKTGETQPTVKNLVITHVTPQDYFPVGPVDEQTGERDPTPQNIAITLDDNDLNDPVDIEVTIRSTAQPTQLLRTLALVQQVGSQHEVTWDGRDDNDDPVETGFYTFDIVVVQPADDDRCGYRSGTLAPEWDRLETDVQDDPGAAATDPEAAEDDTEDTDQGGIEDDTQFHLYFMYRLSEPPQEGSLHVELFQNADVPALDQSPALSEQVRDTRENAVVFTLPPLAEVENLRAVTTADDRHAAEGRNHHPKRCIAFNGQDSVRHVWSYLCFQLNDEHDRSDLYELNWTSEELGWRRGRAWAARSGNNDTTGLAWSANRINSSASTHQWRSSYKYVNGEPLTNVQKPRYGGPTPACWGVNENHEGADGHPYRLLSKGC